MEEKKAMPWMAFIGCVLAVGSLPTVFVLSTMLAQASGEFHAQPLADVVAIIMLIVGIILIYFGLSRRGKVRE